MNFLCLNCGLINDNSSSLICTNCGKELDELVYYELMNYSNRAVHYGYKYRRIYEEDVEKNGKISVKYSITNPLTLEEWLAAAVLGGIVGNLAYDLVKFVCKQIYQKLTTKKENEITSEDKLMLKFINDNNNLKKFILYIQDYYNGLPGINKKILEGIFEEEAVDLLTKKNTKEITEKFNKNGDITPEEIQIIFSENYEKAILETIILRGKKPKVENLKKLFPEVKKKYKKHKKNNQKN